MRATTLLLLFSGLLWSCSQRSQGPMAVTFHNINSKYNALWQAYRIDKSIQIGLDSLREEDYQHLLPIVLPLDSLSLAGFQAQAKEMIRKASLVVERHGNSKWVDEAYLLIAKGRVYQGDALNAIETFKYINSIEANRESQMQALFGLIQIHLQNKQWDAANQVMEVFKELPLSDKERKQLYALKAAWHQVQSQWEASVAFLEEALALSKSKKEKARWHFILGQLEQRQGQATQAKRHFLAALENPGNVEQYFYAQLQLNQLNQDPNALEKMLKEPKNENNADAIYLQLGQIALAKGDAAMAKSYWQQGVAKSAKKGALYVQLSQIHRYQFKQTRAAQAYLDSALLFLSGSDAKFNALKAEAEHWKSYHQAQDRVMRLDSLGKLSQKSLEELMAIHAQAQAKAQAKAQAEREAAQVKPEETKATESPIFTRRPSSKEQQGFYFYNDLVRIKGAQEFVNKWGNRPLEDHWNRASKSMAIPALPDDFQALAPKAKTDSMPSFAQKAEQKKEKIQQQNPVDTSAKGFDAWVKDIPRSPNEQMKWQKALEQGLFEWSKIAYFQLMDVALGDAPMQRLLKEFPQTAYEAEALYLQYLMHPGQAATYRQALFEKYPDSYFKALVLKKETGVLSESKELEASKGYEQAYAIYKQGAFQQSFEACLRLEQQFPGSQVEDKVLFLKSISKAALKDWKAYELGLQYLIQAHPKSPLKTEAEAMLNRLQQNKP